MNLNLNFLNHRIVYIVVSVFVFSFCAFTLSHQISSHDFEFLKTQFANLKLSYLALACLAIFIFILLKTYQAYFFLLHLEKRSYLTLIPWVSFWLMLVQSIPFWLGDVYLLAFFRKKQNFKKITLVSFFTLEQVFEALLTLTLFVFVSFKNPLKLNSSQILFWSFILFIVVFFVLFTLKYYLKNYWDKFIHLLQIWSKSLTLLRSFKAVIWSYCIFLVLKFFELLALYCVVAAFGYHLKIFDLLFVLAMLNFALMIPAAPANLGPFEATVFFTLQQFSLPSSVALGVAFLFHFVSYLPIALMGYLSGFYLHLKK